MRHKLKYIRNIFAFILYAALILSCAAPEKMHPPEISDMEWHSKTPGQILAQLQQDQEEVKDLTAAFSLSIDPPPEGQPSHMRGILFFAKNPEGLCVRIKALGPFGRTMFDLVQEGNILQIYIPSRQTLYRGKTDLKEKDKNIWEETLRTMFPDFSKSRVPEGAVLTFREGMVSVPLNNGKLMIDHKSGLVREHHTQNKIIIYNRYDQKPELPPIPTHIEVKTTDSVLHTVCKLSQIQLNRDISDVFDLSAYNPKNVRDLKELDMTTR